MVSHFQNEKTQGAKTGVVSRGKLSYVRVKTDAFSAHNAKVKSYLRLRYSGTQGWLGKTI